MFCWVYKGIWQEVRHEWRNFWFNGVLIFKFWKRSIQDQSKIKIKKFDGNVHKSTSIYTYFPCNPLYVHSDQNKLKRTVLVCTFFLTIWFIFLSKLLKLFLISSFHRWMQMWQLQSDVMESFSSIRNKNPWELTLNTFWKKIEPDYSECEIFAVIKAFIDDIKRLYCA